jgi:hypothetical protein
MMERGYKVHQSDLWLVSSDQTERALHLSNGPPLLIAWGVLALKVTL